MLATVYCRSCRKEIESSWPNCPHCGASQSVTPSPSPPPVYAVSQAVNSQVANPSMAVQEYTRQYETLNLVAFYGFFLLGAYFLGGVMLFYSFAQKSALRTKVAELGVDPVAWEAPLQAQAARLMWYGLFGLLAIAVIMGIFIAYFSYQTSHMSV